MGQENPRSPERPRGPASPYARFLPAFAILVATLVLMWPAFLNGAPFLFTDTTAYVRAADIAVVKVTGIRSDWTRERDVRHLVRGEDPSPAPASPVESAAPASGPSDDVQRVPLKGRSIYYGFADYLSYVLSSFWLLAAGQALWLATAVYLVCRRYLPPTAKFQGYALVAVVIALATAAPFFAAFMMPDLSAGLMILAIALLVSNGSPMAKGERAFWLITIALASLFHTANILIGAGTLLVIALVRLREFPKIVRTMAPAAGMLAIGIVGEIAFDRLVRMTAGQDPIRPPFVMAQLIEDGPGYKLLRDRCPGIGFTVCKYVDRLPLPADIFLWEIGQSVFYEAPVEDKVALSNEEGRFVRSVWAAYPLEELQASLRRFGKQVFMFELDTFNHGQHGRNFYVSRLPPPQLHRYMRTLGWSGDMPLWWTTPVMALAVVLATLYLLFRLLRRDPQGKLILAAFIGIAINAAVCGVLSSPHHRYQARVIWVLPLLALTLALRRYPEPRSAAEEARA